MTQYRALLGFNYLPTQSLYDWAVGGGIGEPPEEYREVRVEPSDLVDLPSHVVEPLLSMNAICTPEEWDASQLQQSSTAETMTEVTSNGG